ncbi:bacillithiol system redox-active protein YtxJ [Sporosarcina sp. P21c]|uniref:bacillithiol system redox-active protein YtxJ n=1 Tax=unclassified Sporosarcina TaxID=2647733 RepID=UPI000C173883|nr:MULTISPECIES: bacillithiol system redox-active protein YtxJ [unclassified Sporosarcina]PIC66131.1 bacillithiol system redox-active protein YtxJ [Sporosarcina sp. P16a]PIC88662.1 bacillithiol system redox-active protein YtxJ [Sporosarcina sp. P21c]PIC91733.1 bacillithiol system redox-active protein YtxJ [Sporosarcina sp. P25]
MKRIKTIEEWRTVWESSKKQSVLLFKMSLTCFSSLSAKKELHTLVTDLPLYLIVVQTDQAVSKAIETDLNVRHESPQVLIVKDQKATWQATHYHIKASVVRDAIELYS